MIKRVIEYLIVLLLICSISLIIPMIYFAWDLYKRIPPIIINIDGAVKDFRAAESYQLRQSAILGKKYDNIARLIDYTVSIAKKVNDEEVPVVHSILTKTDRDIVPSATQLLGNVNELVVHTTKNTDAISKEVEKALREARSKISDVQIKEIQEKLLQIGENVKGATESIELSSKEFQTFLVDFLKVVEDISKNVDSSSASVSKVLHDIANPSKKQKVINALLKALVALGPIAVAALK